MPTIHKTSRQFEKHSPEPHRKKTFSSLKSLNGSVSVSSDGAGMAWARSRLCLAGRARFSCTNKMYKHRISHVDLKSEGKHAHYEDSVRG